MLLSQMRTITGLAFLAAQFSCRGGSAVTASRGRSDRATSMSFVE